MFVKTGRILKGLLRDLEMGMTQNFRVNVRVLRGLYMGRLLKERVQERK